MTSKDNIIFYTITALVFVGIVVCSLLFHNPRQPTNGDSDRENISTIIIAVLPFVTAAATIVLVGITWWYVRLTQDILKASNNPVVILFLHYQNSGFKLCVENIGTGYASNIDFSGDLSFTPDLPDAKPLRETEPYKNGIKYLGSGHKIETYLCGWGYIETLQKRSFHIEVSYKDSRGTPDGETFFFDLGNWQDTSQFISPQTDDVANAVENVARQLEQANSLRSSESSLQWESPRINQFLNTEDPQITVLERIADALEKKSSDE